MQTLDPTMAFSFMYSCTQVKLLQVIPKMLGAPVFILTKLLFGWI